MLIISIIASLHFASFNSLAFSHCSFVDMALSPVSELTDEQTHDTVIPTLHVVDINSLLLMDMEGMGQRLVGWPGYPAFKPFTGSLYFVRKSFQGPRGTY